MTDYEDQTPSTETGAKRRHFKTVVLDGGILLTGFDYCGKSVNVLDADSIAGWQEVVRQAKETEAITGVVLVSLKEQTFCAGANLELIHDAQARRAYDEIGQLVTTVHQLFDDMASSSKPFVAAVEGACVGGGLELALACHARLASTHSKTCFALPEVRLGIIPGFGGTQRLPRLIGLPAALGMITTGRTIYPRQAFKMGLIDGMAASVPARARTLEAVQKEAVVQAAIAKARALSSAPARRSPGAGRRFFTLPGIRRLVCRYARRQVAKRVQNFYPAPLRAIDAVERGLRRDVLMGSQEIEKPLLLQQLAGPISAHLVGLYLTGETLKRASGSGAVAPARVGVVGAGLMGSQIAGQLAEKGSAVILRDVSAHILAKAMGKIHQAQSAQLRKRVIRPSDLRYRMMRIAPTLRLQDLSGAPLIVEAVSEKLDVKRAVLAELEAVVRPDAIFATNTSSYTLEEITENAVHRERCVGLHFFNPVAKMQLVEVVRAAFTSEAAIAQAVGLAKRLGKFPLVVRDGPGFLVNRILVRYLAEAVILVSEGVSIKRVDAVAKHFGMAVDSGRPMGPLELLDLIGLPVALHVLTSIAVLGPRIESREVLLQSLLPQGKPPMTFWKKGKENPQAVKAIAAYRRAFGQGQGPVSDEVIHKRLFLPMIDEAARCLHDKIVDHPWQVDFGLTYGIGFPAFRGGLLTWARQTMTPAQVADELQSLAVNYGKRFEPCESLAREVFQSHSPSEPRL